MKQESLNYIKTWVVKNTPYILKQRAMQILNPKAYYPFLGDSPYGGPKDSPITFVMVVRSGFDINRPNAATTILLGFCHGFAQLGIRYQLISVYDLEKRLPKLKNPFIFLSSYNYLDINKRTRKLLSKYPHLVWVYPDLDVLRDTYKKYHFSDIEIPERLYDRVIDSRPNFVMAPVPPTALKFYSEWKKRGMKIKSIPLACDTTRYYPTPDNKKYSDVKIAFVGGYWQKKAIQFDKYLKPYEDILTVYGYSHWPYKGYKGLLSEGDEKVLYHNATVSPAISEAHAEAMGDIVERAFKVMGSGGLAVTDATKYYRELFKPKELLIPKDMNEYNKMIMKALYDEEFNRRYREKGYDAVMKRHTYLHRAKTILNYLDIDFNKR